jgi:hypothetical protein
MGKRTKKTTTMSQVFLRLDMTTMWLLTENPQFLKNGS